MRIAHVNTYDISGGAARAAYRLHRGLLEECVDSAMFVRAKLGDDVTVRQVGSVAATLRAHANTAVAWPYRGRNEIFTTSPLPDRVIQTLTGWKPDVVNLHWIAEGFVSPRSLRAAKCPIVWTLHDTYPFTGGCHYPLECRRYTGKCGACRALKSRSEWDLSRAVWLRKHRAWRDLDLTIVTPSRWMAACARESSLFRERRIEVIPYGLDLGQFRPVPRELAREILRIPQDRRYVLFIAVGGASNPIKGFAHLAAALQSLKTGAPNDRVELLLAGTANPPTIDFGIAVRCVGMLRDDVSIALLNSAADVVAVPSVQDNFPNTILEALACGRPVAAFRIGGNPDMITDRVDGALAQPFDPVDLGRSIAWLLEDEPRWHELSAAARRTAEDRYALGIQARRYEALYRELTAPGRQRAPVTSGT
jgi:glycosyltransferase involved in cell wall biosynthesis